MSFVTVNVDTSVLDELAGLGEAATMAARQAAEQIAAQAHAKAVELANQRLHERRRIFVEALQVYREGDFQVLSLDASARWVDDGLEPHDMLADLLASPKAKHSKDGGKYLVIPFSHGPGHGPAETGPAAMDLVSAVRREMKSRKIPWAAIERDDQGRPKMGRLHKFDVGYAPLKSQNGPGQGWGPVGDVRQGPNARQASGDLAKNASKYGGGGGGTPFLQGVGVYQRRGSDMSVQRSVMTFRVASTKQEGTGRWQHPGLPPAKIFEAVEEWVVHQLEAKIFPDLLERLVG